MLTLLNVLLEKVTRVIACNRECFVFKSVSNKIKVMQLLLIATCFTLLLQLPVARLQPPAQPGI